MDDLKLLKQAVTEAGEIALKYFGKNPKTETKSDGSEVSEADLKVNEHLYERLTKGQPDYGWLSEESEDDPKRLDKERVWIVDPIDGTRGFLRNATDWTVAVGLLENGKPIAGCVFAPARKEFYAAQKGETATLNDTPISTTSRSVLKDATLIAGKGILKSDAWIGPWPEVELIWSNSMAYRLCLVAAGKADATISLSPKSDWDLAGAEAILQSAKGMMTVEGGLIPTYNKKEVRHENIIAAGTNMSETLLSLVKNRKHG